MSLSRILGYPAKRTSRRSFSTSPSRARNQFKSQKVLLLWFKDAPNTIAPYTRSIIYVGIIVRTHLVTNYLAKWVEKSRSCDLDPSSYRTVRVDDICLAARFTVLPPGPDSSCPESGLLQQFTCSSSDFWLQHIFFEMVFFTFDSPFKLFDHSRLDTCKPVCY